MKKTQLSLLKLGALALTVSAAGCVQQRPSRNGVFNENQYVRKDFLVGPGDNKATDNGWMLKGSVTSVNTPNALGGVDLWAGIESGLQLVRFVVTEDKLQMVSMREVTAVADPAREPEVVNAWPVTNVDLKYRVNLDGENTNFFEENQELAWQDRQWVKVKFAKNDMSDVAPLGIYFNDVLNKCADMVNAMSTLVPGSFNVDTKNNYMEWSVQISAPLLWSDATCVAAYGELGQEALRIGRQSITFTLKYSMSRALPASAITYTPLEIAEKDPIHHKYGPIEMTTFARDEASGQPAARQFALRFDPTKPFVWYFAPGFPDEYKKFFLDPGGIKDQTNQLFKDAGATATVDFQNFDANLVAGQAPRAYGDVRYNFLVWMKDRDMQPGYAGVTQFAADPRTGELISASIRFNDFSIKDYYVQRIDAYLQTIGASSNVNSTDPWMDLGACMDGDTMPIISANVASDHNANSSVYAKMQQYLQKPQSLYGNLGAQDFIATQDEDFFRAYFALAPYAVFSDPDSNQFVTREGGSGVYGPGAIWKLADQERQFQELAAKIDRGETPYNAVTGQANIPGATAFLNQFRDLTKAHKDYLYARQMVNHRSHVMFDSADAFSLEQVMAKDARHCVNGKWETKEQWVSNLISTYWSQVAWHEFGHALGLEHNFMASIDRNNFPHYKDGAGRDHIGMYSNSVMEYNTAPDRVFWHAGWAPYDQGAISWIYANNKQTPLPSGMTASAISGQLDANTPWKDPHGFQTDGKTEIQYLRCDETHAKYTPLCRAGDLGITPSEIVANDLDRYEWQYKWRNFRQYRKYWDNSAYANTPAQLFIDSRRFLSQWAFDWSPAELADTFRRLGIANPNPNSSALEYYAQLSAKFIKEMTQANMTTAAFHKAIIQQSSGERPYRTIYDKFYGDTTQQGIILDKLFAMQGWVGLWPTDNYDQNQAGGYIASYTLDEDSLYQSVAEDAVASMIGGQYNVYPYFVPLAVAQFAQDTHSPAFGGRVEVRDWIGGHTFGRLQDFLDFFRDLAVQKNYKGCTSFDTCKYDPRILSDTHNEFFGPDKRTWIWAYIADRNQWVAVQKDRNIASYIIVRNYTDDVIYQLDDGAFPGGAYGAELPMKYFLDSFTYFN